uniref:Uncharacterized protein n=1 Tax=Tetranychus urticae TaxID=32264 RepID=T1KX82_TETUR
MILSIVINGCHTGQTDGYHSGLDRLSTFKIQA